jgi:hypothetical protein
LRCGFWQGTFAHFFYKWGDARNTVPDFHH